MEKIKSIVLKSSVMPAKVLLLHAFKIWSYSFRVAQSEIIVKSKSLESPKNMRSDALKNYYLI